MCAVSAMYCSVGFVNAQGYGELIMLSTVYNVAHLLKL